MMREGLELLNRLCVILNWLLGTAVLIAFVLVSQLIWKVISSGITWIIKQKEPSQGDGSETE